jgi:uncharacterized SAM-binding protein YcdF (DUF218 family)
MEAVNTKDDPVVMLFGMFGERISETKKFDVAIALASGRPPKGLRANGRSRACILMAAILWENRRVEKIIASGGKKVKGITNAKTAAETMRYEISDKYGVLQHVLLENKSTDTFEMALNTLKMMKENGFKSAIILADTLHAKRVKKTFQKQWRSSGLKFLVVPTYGRYGTSERYASPETFWLYNLGATVYSKLRGWM